MAKLICQAKVDEVQCGPNANKAELAMGFQLKKIEPCRKANAQNSNKRSHLFLDPERQVYVHSRKNLSETEVLIRSTFSYPKH